jgi:tetratricopeptide (TPR) repeat protein
VPDEPSSEGPSPDRAGGDAPRRAPRPARSGPPGSRDEGSPRRGAAPPGRGRREPSAERTTPPGLDVPKGSNVPLGLDKARTRAGAPPRAVKPKVSPPKPELPADEEPQLPRAIQKEIDRVIGKNARGRDVALALSIGSAAIDEGYLEVAVEMLTWAKDEAPRIAAVREAYGVALYLTEDFAGALSELQAYRRLTGKVDQNHLVADCLRALGRDLDRVVDAAQELLADTSAPPDRRTEAAIVWAAALADTADLGAARSVLRRVTRDAGDEEHDLRARYLAADYAVRDGDVEEARSQLELVVAADPDYLDAGERLAQL